MVAKLYDGKITKVLKNLQQNNSETVINEYDKQIPKERYISLEKRQKVIDISHWDNSITMKYQKITKV